MFESSRPKVRWVSCWSPAKSRHLCFSSLLRLRFYMIFKVIGLWLRLLVDESWWKLMKAHKRCRLRAAGDYLLHSLLVGRLIGMKFIHQSESCLLFLSWIFLGGETFDLLSSVAHVFQETCICHDHLQPTKEVVFWFPCSSCTRKTWTCQPLWRLVSPLMRTFSTTGRMVANIMVINDKHWQTYYAIDVCIDNLILPSFTL